MIRPTKLLKTYVINHNFYPILLQYLTVQNLQIIIKLRERSSQLRRVDVLDICPAAHDIFEFAQDGVIVRE
jgi:hypothetical protein